MHGRRPAHPLGAAWGLAGRLPGRFVAVRFTRFRCGQGETWAVADGDTWLELGGAPWDDPPRLGPIDVATAVPLPPVAPGKIVCIGSNYRAHAAEMGRPIPDQPLLFLKPPSALLAPGGAIVRPRASQRVDYEGELGAILGRRLRHASPAAALAAVAGWTCVNDVTARDLQRRDVQFTRGKGFDTFCPVGPWAVSGLDPAELSVETWLDGSRVQSGQTADMVFPVGELLAFISAVMTLEPGDLVSTGTPAGVGPLQAGQRVEVRIPGIGSLVNDVVDE